MFKRLVSTLVGAALTAGAFAMAAPASAAGYPNAVATGTMSVPVKAVSFCATECVTNGILSNFGSEGVHRAIVDPSVDAFTVLPKPGSYRIAVAVNGQVGYLAAAGGQYKLVDSFAAADVWAVETFSDLGHFDLAVAPASPEKPAVEFANFKGYMDWSPGEAGLPEYPGVTVALCEVDCLTSSGTVITEKTGHSKYWARGGAAKGSSAFAIDAAPVSDKYKLAVSFHYNPEKYSGYLVEGTDGYYRLERFAKANRITLDEGSEPTFVVQFESTPVVTTPRVKPRAKTTVVPYMELTNGSYSNFRFDVLGKKNEATVKVTFRGCGGQVAGVKVDKRKGARSIYVRPNTKRMGKDWTVAITVSEKGVADRVDRWNAFGGKHGKFTCGGKKASPKGKGGSKKAALVKKWSKKATKVAVAGKRVKITRTVAAGPAKVKYRWTLNGKKVSSKPAVKLPKAAKGKTLKVKIVVSKKGAKATKVLSYGKVK